MDNTVGTYFHDLYAELFVVGITPLVETDLLGLFPIYAPLLQMTFRQRQPQLQKNVRVYLWQFAGRTRDERLLFALRFASGSC